MMRTFELNLQTSLPKVQSSPMAEGLGFPRIVIRIELEKRNQKETNRQILKDESLIHSKC